MFDKFKQSLGQSASAVKFKADQLIKINNIQGEIAAVQRDMGGVREQIANLVLALHQRGELPVPELEPLCAQLEGLMGEVAQKQALIEALKAEPTPGQAPQPPQPQVPPQPSYPPQPAAPAAVKTCPNCQASAPAAAAFCTNCGYNFPPAPAQPAARTTRTCPHCQFEAPAASAFCPNCGKSMAG